MLTKIAVYFKIWLPVKILMRYHTKAIKYSEFRDQHYLLLKSSFSEKVTKMRKNPPLVLTLLSKTSVLSKEVGDFFKFCGLLIMSEL